MVAKLKKVNPRIVSVLMSWFQQRSARVEVGGRQSDVMNLQDMVYQGILLGTALRGMVFLCRQGEPLMRCVLRNVSLRTTSMLTRRSHLVLIRCPF